MLQSSPSKLFLTDAPRASRMCGIGGDPNGLKPVWSQYCSYCFTIRCGIIVCIGLSRMKDGGSTAETEDLVWTGYKTQ